MVGSKNKKQGFLASLREIVVLLLIVFIIRTFGFGLYQVPSGSMETTMLVGERFFADKFSYLFVSPKPGDIIAFNAPMFNYSDNKLMRLFQEYVWGPQNITKRVIGIPGDTIKGVVEDGKPVIYRNGEKLDETYLNKYPLLPLFKASKQEIEKKMLDLFMQQGVRPSEINEGQFIEFRSYDPAFSFYNQPFYRINPDQIVEGVAERKPGTPLQGQWTSSFQEGKSRWNGTDDFYIELGENQYWVMGDNRLGSHDSRFFGPIDGGLIHGKIIFRIWSVDSGENWWIIDLIKHPIDFWSRMRWSRFFQFVN